MIKKLITFESDGLELTGTLHLPGLLNPPVVIGSHGMLSSSESPKQLLLAKNLIKQGIAYFRFDHRGCGKSEGNFRKLTTFNGRVNDMLAAIDRIMNHARIGGPLALFGSSMGGAVVLACAAMRPVKAVVTLAAPVRFTDIQLNNAHLEDPRTRGMTADQLDFDISDKLNAVSNIMVFHGTKDNIVPFSCAKEIIEKTREPKRLVPLEGGDHPLSIPDHQKLFLKKSIGWFVRWLVPDSSPMI